MSKASKKERRRRRKRSGPPTPQQRYESKLRTALDRMRASLDRTSLPVAEALVKKLLYVIDEGGAVVPSDETKHFVSTTLTKLTNESVAYVASLRGGSAWGAFHHSRAIIETAAAANYIASANPKKRAKRLEKYDSYPDLFRYQRMQLGSPALRGLPPPTQEQVAEWEKRLPQWKRLYGREPKDVDHWHCSANIENLVTLMDGGVFWEHYEWLCHAIHVSPIGHRLVASGNPLILGFRGDESHLLIGLQVFVMAFARSLLSFDALLDEKLLPALEPEASALLKAAEMERAAMGWKRKG